jgi:hypothetical protein
MMRYSSIPCLPLLLSALLVLCSAAPAQRSTVRLSPLGRPNPGPIPQVFSGDLIEIELTDDGNDDAEEKSDESNSTSKEDEAWLKAFKKLKFNRHPSKVLEAWSTPLEEEEENKDETTEGEEAGDAEEATEDGAAEEDTDSEQATVVVEEGVTEEEPDENAETDAQEESDTTEETEDEEEGESKEEKERRKKARDLGLKRFERDLVLSNWNNARAYLAQVPKKVASQAYTHLLSVLAKGVNPPSGQNAEYAEMPFYSDADLVSLASIAPGEFKTPEIKHLGRLLKHMVSEGSLVEVCVAKFRAALEDENCPLERDQLAHILLEGNFPAEAGEFLPTLSEAKEAEDRPVLNLLARHFLARYRKDANTPDLRAAWDATQSALLPGKIDKKVRMEALRRAVTIAPQIDEELGQVWLKESFTDRSALGMEILSIIGSTASTGLRAQIRLKDQRLQSLTMQATAAEALIKHNPDLAQTWQATLGVLANNWLQEAFFTYERDTTSTRGQSMRFDSFGNVYYSSYSSSSFGRSGLAPVPTNDLLDIRPSLDWLRLVSESMRPKFEMVTAQLLLKIEAEEEAFPHIERLARVFPDQAEELVEEFLRVWIKNHNPNSNSGRTNNYMFIYSFQPRQAGIPLTRSKQERNLTELAGWIARIRALPLERVDEELVAEAFTTAHSAAEVYKLETIERVFGAMGGLEARTTAALVQEMRSNLVSVWRRPSTQENNKTNRRQKDIEQEILLGYGVAAAVTAKALLDHPNDWSLAVAEASIAHDENNYRQELEKTPEFAGQRAKALDGFARAAQHYEEAVPDLKEKEQTTSLYETWFYASLGACDLGALNSRHLSAQDQFARIREAILSLPGEAAERHMGKFANSLVTRIASVNPAAKYRYLKAGLEIAGDHEQTREAQKIFEYYGDLVTEIKLETVVDGTDHVGSGEPFGLFVNLRHTAAIEREAGGFGKYLVNQNTNAFGFNYGRPTENYRDKFEEFTREVLSEHFNVRSVTFNQPDTHSRATAEYGWRITPYAYILLEALGPEIDRVPALRLDLDFMDSAGYAVLPIESAPVPIDAQPDTRDTRPFADLKLTQTLDERQAADGKLLLEIQASALGLLPDLHALIDLQPEGFDIVETEDLDVSVTKFDEESTEPLVVTQRTWMVTLEARDDLKQLPETFTFAGLQSGEDEAEFIYQRYVDADLATVGPTVVFEERYGAVARSGPLPWLLGLGALIGLWFAARAVRARRAAAHITPDRYRVPDPVSPFNVLGLLRQIETSNGISDDFRSELLSEISQLETHYFRQAADEAPDLTHIARTWVSRTR